MPAIKGMPSWNKGRKMTDYPHCGFQKGHKNFTLWGNGRKHTEKSRKKISLSLMGRKPPRTAFKSEDMIGENHWNWRGGMPKCKKCGKLLTTRNPHTGYCRKCYASIFIGEKNPKWIKDRLSIARVIGGNERKGLAYYYWRTSVLNRDGHVCKINNGDCQGKLEVHHILSWKDFPELRYEINNGITLCQAHHPRKRVEEKRLIPFFQGLVPVSNGQF
jgi:hypothetical protein